MGWLGDIWNGITSAVSNTVSTVRDSFVSAATSVYDAGVSICNTAREVYDWTASPISIGVAGSMRGASNYISRITGGGNAATKLLEGGSDFLRAISDSASATKDLYENFSNKEQLTKYLDVVGIEKIEDDIKNIIQQKQKKNQIAFQTGEYIGEFSTQSIHEIGKKGIETAYFFGKIIKDKFYPQQDNLPESSKKSRKDNHHSNNYYSYYDDYTVYVPKIVARIDSRQENALKPLNEFYKELTQKVKKCNDLKNIDIEPHNFVALIGFNSEDLDYLEKVKSLVEKAIKDNYLKYIIDILKEGFPKDFLFTSQDNFLHLAIRYKRDELINYLLNNNPTDLDVGNINGYTPAHYAVFYGEPELIKSLVKAKINFNAQNNLMKTPIQLAAQEPQYHEKFYVILEGAKPNLITFDNEGKNIIFYGITGSHKAGEIKVLQRILQENININSQDNQGLTPLYLATALNNRKIVKELLKHQPNANLSDNKNIAPIHIATERGYNGILKELLENSNANINLPGENNVTAIYLAALRDNDEGAEILIKHKANLEFKDFELKTPLIISILFESHNVAKLLIENGAELESSDIQGLRAIHHAMKSDNKDFADLLLKYGVDVYAEDNEGKAPIHHAVENNNRTGVQQLYEYLGGNRYYLNLEKYGKWTPLHEAVMSSNVEMIEDLVEKGAHRNPIAFNGFTPIHLAAEIGNVKVINKLAILGLNVTAKSYDESGADTPLHLAVFAENLDAVIALLNAQAIVNEANNLGDTPLHIAGLKGHLYIVRILLEKGAMIHKNKEGLTPYEYAAKNNHVEVMKLIEYYFKYE